MVYQKPAATFKTLKNASPLWRLVSPGMDPIVLLNNASGGISFYCIHGITGDISRLATFARQFEPFQRVYGIQVPKEKMNASFGQSIEAMAQYYVEAILSTAQEGPVVLCGWSAGAVVMIEMANLLRQRGIEVPLLVAADGGPFQSKAGPVRWGPVTFFKILRNLPHWLRQDLRHHDWRPGALCDRIYRKFRHRFADRVLAFGKEQTLQPQAVERLLRCDVWLANQRSFIQSMYQAVQAYVPDKDPGRVMVFEAAVEPLFRPRHIAALWKRVAANVEVFRLTGSHGDLFSRGNAGFIAGMLRPRLMLLTHEAKEQRNLARKTAIWVHEERQSLTA